MDIFGPDKRVSKRRLDETLRGSVRRGEISESDATRLREKLSKAVTLKEVERGLRDAKEHYVTQGYKLRHLERFEERAGLVKPAESSKKK